MLFLLAVIIGLVSLVLLLFSPIAGIIGFIIAIALVWTNSNRNRQRLEAQRHAELVQATKEGKNK